MDGGGYYAGMTDAADPAEVEKAGKLFRRFQSREPVGSDLILVGGLVRPVVALAVGEAIAIGYKALGDGKDYYHEFGKDRPAVFVNADGSQVYFVGGSYRFTDRGFVG